MSTSIISDEARRRFREQRAARLAQPAPTRTATPITERPHQPEAANRLVADAKLRIGAANPFSEGGNGEEDNELIRDAKRRAARADEPSGDGNGEKDNELVKDAKRRAERKN